MLRKILFVSILLFVLAACSSQPTPETDLPVIEQTEQLEPQVTVTEQPIEEAAHPTENEPEEIPAAGDAETGNLEVFQIVPEESQISYEVGEVFLNQNNAFNMAIGVTSQVSGEIFVDRDNPQNSSIGPVSVDISQFQSDSARRDNAIRNRFLESSKYPISTFTPLEIQGLPEDYQEGDQITFQVSGDLSVREMTLPVTFDVTMSGEEDMIVGEAETVILMSDFGFGPISIGGILNTEDEVRIVFKFVARP